MSAITTLDRLMERVLEEEKRNHDILADTRRMSLGINEDDLVLDVDGAGIYTEAESLFLGDHAIGQMATDLGIPKRYFDRMREADFDLLKTNVHHWLYQEPNRRMIRSRRSDGGDLTARAWLSDRYRRLDNIEIATKLLPEFARLGTDVEFHNAAITDTRFYLRATFPSMEKAVKVGDPVRWGVADQEQRGRSRSVRHLQLRPAPCLHERHGREQGDERPARRQAPRREPLRRGDPG